MKFKKTVVEPSCIGSFKIVKAKMKIEQILPRNHCIGYGLSFQGSLFLHQPLKRQFFGLHIESNSINNYHHQTQIKSDYGQKVPFSIVVSLLSKCQQLQQKMRKLYKLLTLANLTIELDQACEAKEISRVRIRVFEEGDPSSSAVIVARMHSSKMYADISDNRLIWHQPIEFRYTGQTRLTFQTDCEHQYGYNLEELQVLYNGLIYIKNQMFFRPDFCHIYSPEGEKKGVLKLEVRVVTKEEEHEQQHKIEMAVPLVRQDLVGLIKINNSSLDIVNPSFNKKRHEKMDLSIHFGKQSFSFEPKAPFRWTFLGLKLEYIQKGAETIRFQMIDDDKVVLDGIIECSYVAKQKRYTTIKIAMFSKNGIKMGFLMLEFRYLAKQELLDLIYSPNNKLNYTERSHSSQPGLFDSRLLRELKVSSSRKKSLFSKQSSPILPNNRYKIGYLMNRNSDILMPKANRFSDQKTNNPNISYIDPKKVSDFSPKKQKGLGMSRGSKFDFTRQFKDNPGVGEYQLPSIWSKY